MEKKLSTNCLRSLLITLIFLTAACNKEQVSSSTDSNKSGNQLVCKVDGVEWKSSQVLYSGFFDYSPTFNRRYLYLHYVNGRQEINIFINPPFNQSSYIINRNTLNYPTTSYPENYLSLEKYYDDLTLEKMCITGNSDKGRIDFTVLDTVNHIVKGKFYFKGKDKHTGKEVSVTDGYFDFHE